MPRSVIGKVDPRQRALRAARLAGLALLLAGTISCSGRSTPEPDREARHPAPSTATATATRSPPAATPSATSSPVRSLPPARPQLTGEFNEENASAVAKYFVELFPYIHNTGDLEEWRRLSHPECVFCRSGAESAELLAAQGNHVEGGDISWPTKDPVVLVYTDLIEVQLVVTEAPSVLISKARGQLSESPASTHTLAVFITHEGHDLLVRGVDILEEGDLS